MKVWEEEEKAKRECGGDQLKNEVGA